MRNVKDLKEDALIVGDCYKGVNFVGAHLEQFPTESDEKYKWRRKPNISKFTNFTAAAINGVTGVALNKLPQVEDNLLKPLIKKSADSIIKSCIDMVTYLVIDAPKIKGNQQENKPYLSIIGINRVLGAPEIDGALQSFYFHGSESIAKGKSSNEPTDEYETVERKYRKRIFSGGGEKLIEKKGKWVVIDSWETSFSDLPVVKIDVGVAEKHPFIDIAQLNLWLYNLESDDRNILHVVSAPFHQFFGEVQKNSDGDALSVTIGADQGWAFTDKSKEGIQITEAEGKGVSHLEKRIESTGETITRMAVSVISKQNYKTATQSSDASMKGLGFLPFIVMETELAFNRAIEIMALFRGKEYKGGIVFNKSFKAVDYDQSALSYIASIYDKGAITKATMLKVGKSAGILNSDMDVDEEIKAAEEEQGNSL